MRLYEAKTHMDGFRTQLAKIFDEYTGMTIMHSTLGKLKKEIEDQIHESIKIGELPDPNQTSTEHLWYSFGIGYIDKADFTELTPEKIELYFYNVGMRKYMKERLEGLTNVRENI